MKKYLILSLFILIFVIGTVFFISRNFTGVTNMATVMASNFLENIGLFSSDNFKDLSKYEEGQVFLVSDEDWKSVLTLVPAAIWTNQNNSIVKYPVLIYHKEVNNFDIDSIYHFVKQRQRI